MNNYHQIMDLMNGTATIPAAQVREWMKSSDIEVLGALYVLTTRAWARIQPELGMQPTCEFILRYYQRCIIEDPASGEHLLGRYAAGHALAAWFSHLWGMRPETDAILEKARQALAELYKHDDAARRECVVNACLEHIFEQQAQAEFFADWKNDPVLANAYTAALQWGKSHRRPS